MFVSVTRLRIRSVRFLPAFMVFTLRALRQVRAAEGFEGGALLPDRRWTFWTMTAWTGPDAMRAYMTTGPHRTAMPKLQAWCDEASVVHWEQADAALPSWPAAAARMLGEGRPSAVRHPSPDHLSMTFAEPRVAFGGPISPR